MGGVGRKEVYKEVRFMYLIFTVLNVFKDSLRFHVISTLSVFE